jgi:hypothetical protein
VDGAAFPAKGRKVKCASCDHRWIARPPIDAPQPVEEDDDVELAPPTRSAVRVKAAAAPAAPVSRTRSPAATSRRPAMGLALAGMFVLLLLVGAVIVRNQIIASFPATAAIYQRLGLPVEMELGLEFNGVTSGWQVEGGASVLVVEGEIVNLSEDSRVIPPVRIAILDGDGRELQHDFFTIEESVLSGGNRTSFSGRLVNPVEQGQDFRLSFDLES